jgi:hypothetical protein
MMRSSHLISTLSITCSLLAGCISSDPGKFSVQVRKWLPLGTPATDAQRIMEHHGFECHYITTNNTFNLSGRDYMDCDREQVRFHDWSVRLIFEDRKLAEFGFIKTN